MDEFELPVVYNGAEIAYKAKLLAVGYVYKFLITVNGVELVFERDDEGNFRVLNSDTEDVVIDNQMIEAIIDSLKKITD